MTDRLCPGCGCVLSRFNDDDYCAPCQKAGVTAQVAADAVEAAVEACYLEGEELVCAVAGVLLTHYARDPGHAVYLQEELRKMGVEATSDKIYDARRLLNRRGFDIVAMQGRPGYVLRAWLTPTLTWAARRHQHTEERKLLDVGSDTDEEDT